MSHIFFAGHRRRDRVPHLRGVALLRGDSGQVFAPVSLISEQRFFPGSRMKELSAGESL